MSQLSAPGKAFIAGEYIAVQGGPCLVMATLPNFKMNVQQNVFSNEQVHAKNFFAHIESPAGRYARKFPELFQNEYLFEDAYQGRGGFGASTAQFLMLYAWHLRQSGAQVQASEMLKVYRDCAYSGVGLEPSGADLIAQWQGGFTFIEKRRNQIQTQDYPFSDLDLILFSTGVKLPTHEHLAKLQSFDSSNLESAFQMIQNSWSSVDSMKFVQGILNFREALQSLNFEAATTTKMIEKISADLPILAAKGCGALGSDVILLVTKPDQSSRVQQYLQEQGFNFIMTQKQVSSGLKI